MLEAMRNASKTWLAKLLLIVLVLAFASWGITDYLSPGGRAPAITVGKVAYPDQGIRDQFVTRLNALRAQGYDISTEQAVEAGMLTEVARDIVRDLVYAQAGGLFGLRPGDEAVRRTITTNPDFAGAGGRFDRAILQDYLRQRGYSEIRFVESIRNDLARSYLLAPVSGGVHYPEPGVRAYSAFVSERRTGDVLLVDASLLPAPKKSEAGEAALQETWERNLATFTTPEIRRATVLLVTPEALEEKITVTDEDVTAWYETHRQDFVTPQRRQVRQSLFQTRDQAEKARLAASGGETLEAATTAAGGSGPFLLGTLTIEDLPGPVADAVFAQEVGVPGEPVHSDAGWHLFLVESGTPAQQQPLEAVRDEVRLAILDSRLPELVYETSMAIENDLGGGVTLEEVAEEYGVPLIALATDARGITPDGQPVSGLPENTNILTSLFAGSETGVGVVTEFENGHYVLRLEEIIPPTPKPLDTVRNEVLDLWVKETRLARARDLAGSLLEKARSGAGFARLSREHPAAQEIAFGPVSRLSLRDTAGTAGSRVLETPGTTPDSLPVLDAVFETEPGQTSLVPLPGGAALVHVREILPPDPREAKVEREKIRGFLDSSFARDVKLQFDESVARTVGYSINRDRLEKIILQE